MSDGEPATAEQDVPVGERVYDADGNELGRVRGGDRNGFYVATVDGVVSLSVEHEADSMAGEKELLWRCWQCGALGELSRIPERCPDCGAAKEELYYWIED